MALSAGTRLGPYEILSALGTGAMGEVYRARDTNLNRDVAMKILPDLFTSDPERLARFQREAQVLASLNHPHIAAVYGLEQTDGVSAIVLELVEGETLAGLIARGPLAVGDALPIARQIAEALEAAHEKGVVHRDVKPANIKVRPDGAVKVLDFGLAKAGAGEDARTDLTQSPTMTFGGTRKGAILGTAAYMSPEQARGRPLDKRTDIWAFGCVLYEMLTGRAAFQGDTFADTLAAILEREPDWRALPGATPLPISRLLRRSLEKDPRQRLRDIGDARNEIDDALQAQAHAQLEQTASTQWSTERRVLVAGVVCAFAAVCAAAAAIYFQHAPGVASPVRLSVSTPGQITPQLSATLSPDGRELAFVSTDASGKSMLWIRALDALEARVIPGTENAAHPFWSPDGRSLGFLADSKLKRVDAAGGPVQTLADSALRNGGSWSQDGLIVFANKIGEGLAAIRSTGGVASPLTTLDRTRGDTSHGWPHFLPDGRHFLYFASSDQPEQRGVYVGSVESKETKHLLTTDFKATYAPPGYLLFLRDETLMAQPFDAARLELSGEPVPVADGVWTALPAAQASFSASRTGVLAYVNATQWNSQLSWFDRKGQPLGRVGPPDRYWAQIPQLARDAKRIAIGRGRFGRENIWLLDADGGTSVRFTFGGTGDATPIWSADGGRIMFRSAAVEGGSRLYLKNASGAGSEQLVLVSGMAISLEDWSHDGRFVVFARPGKQSPSDLWLLQLEPNARPRPFLEMAFNKTQAKISPDGRWIAYTSNESGGDEVYVQSFPVPGSKRQISTSGGVQARWRNDGRELYYLASDQRLMAVPVKGGVTFDAGAPAPLFRTRLLAQGSQSVGLPTSYDVSPDGQRFLLNVRPDDLGPPVTIVLNWMSALKK
jgi:eukaryotic-like serine/threonine-protein kinase